MSKEISEAERRTLRFVISASSVGTLIEWYDFYIFGSLATILATQFFPKGNPTAAFLSTLATFATGFIVRPFGALVFGRVGDMVGRKYAFLVTLIMMGMSTTLIGILPSYAQVGALAPVLLVLLRLVQGLALGGEYGGATTYVAEHAPDARRGFYTSFIQTTATLGLFVSILVILGVQEAWGKAALETWAWRVPFLLSAVLVMVSILIRLKMAESPLYTEIKEQGATSENPLHESFVHPENRRLVLLALFGATAGQGVVWYTGQFFAMNFLEKVLGLDRTLSFVTVAVVLLLATPFFVAFGSLSDRIGRKPLIVGACFAAAILYLPIYAMMIEQAKGPNWIALGALVFVQVILVTMVYGPIAAFLVELFPTRIRYTSMSLPYHIGNGVFGGLVPFIATALVTTSGNKLMGLAYPIAIALITAIVGYLALPDRTGVSLSEA